MSTALTRDALARCIDHTLLKPEATQAQIDQLCAEARLHNFAAVCVNPYWITRCVAQLEGSQTAVATVVGFPLGANTTATKAYEAQAAVAQGAHEVDMVVNLGALIANDRDAVINDIAAVVGSVKSTRPDALVKVILETRALTDPQIILGCQCCVAARADYVKTSTGFGTGGNRNIVYTCTRTAYA